MGEIDESNPAALLGQKGGLARAASLTAKERSEVGRKAVQVRWDRYRAAKAAEEKAAKKAAKKKKPAGK